MRSLLHSFRHAMRGIHIAARGGRNVRIHIIAAIAIALLAHLGRVEPWAWACLLLCFGLVLGAELINSALETLCDRVEPSVDARIRDCKDIAAGGVLICAVLATIVGAIVFLRGDVLATLRGSPWELVALGAATAVAIGVAM